MLLHGIVFEGIDVDHGNLITAHGLHSQIAEILAGPGSIDAPDSGVRLRGVRMGLRNLLLRANEVEFSPVVMEQWLVQVHTHVQHFFAEGQQHPHRKIVQRRNAWIQQGRGLSTPGGACGAGRINIQVQTQPESEPAKGQKPDQ